MTAPPRAATLSWLADEIWIRCEHCKLPHARSARICPTTKKPIATKRISRKVRDSESLPHFPAFRATNAESLPQFPASSTDPRSSGAEHSIDSVLSSGDHKPPRGHGKAVPIEGGDILEDKYEVVRLLGSGAMGSVFECRHLLLQRPVAIKVLHRETAANSVLVRRFRREARIAGALGHPNICRTYDFGDTPRGIPFLVMEMLEGESLAARLTREPQLPFELTLQIGHQMLSALAAAHAAGIVHRDIKPANVFLVRSGNSLPLIKLIDFGISKSSSERTQLTRIGHVVGTPAYMAPEQTDGLRIDHRVDLYSTGVVLYECITGQRPFEARVLDELLHKVRRGLFPSMRLLRPDVPPRIENLVLHAMQPGADKRPASAGEMASEINAILSDLFDPPSKPSTPPQSMSVDLDVSQLTDEEDEEDDRTEVRRPRFD